MCEYKLYKTKQKRDNSASGQKIFSLEVVSKFQRPLSLLSYYYIHFFLSPEGCKFAYLYKSKRYLEIEVSRDIITVSSIFQSSKRVT